MKVIRSIAVTCSFLSLTALAYDYETVTVCALQTHTNSNYAYLRVCDARPSNNGCKSGSFISWNITDGQGNVMYSTAMAAMVSGNPVTVKLDGRTCISSYDETSMIRILKK